MVLAKAKEENARPIAPAQMDNAFASMSGKKAKGIDAIGPIEI